LAHPLAEKTEHRLAPPRAGLLARRPSAQMRAGRITFHGGAATGENLAVASEPDRLELRGRSAVGRGAADGHCKPRRTPSGGGLSGPAGGRRLPGGSSGVALFAPVAGDADRWRWRLDLSPACRKQDHLPGGLVVWRHAAAIKPSESSKGRRGRRCVWQSAHQYRLGGRTRRLADLDAALA